MEAKLRKLWVETGRHGADKLYDKAVREGLDVKRKVVQEFVKAQSSAQVFQPRVKSEGRVVATGPRKTWQIDIIDFKQFSEKTNKGFKYLLVAVDVFDRTMKTAALKTKSPEETAKVFRTFAPFPDEVDADHGSEWTGAFQKLLDTHGIGRREKDPKQINALAVADRAMGTLKKMIGKGMTDKATSSWYTEVKGAVNAYNNTSHSHLMGSHPNDVSENKVLTYELKAKAGEDIKHNFDQYDDKLAALKKAGAFRTMLSRNTWDRASQPKWGAKVHKVSRIVGADVVDTENDRFPIKLVLPVPAASKPATVPVELLGGRPARVPASTNTLKPFAKKLEDELKTAKSLSLQVAGRKMNAEDGFKEAMKEAKIVGFGSFKRFVQLFPDKFKLEGAAPRITVRKA